VATKDEQGKRKENRWPHSIGMVVGISNGVGIFQTFSMTRFN
jgi:hypothetical protein